MCGMGMWEGVSQMHIKLMGGVIRYITQTIAQAISGGGGDTTVT